VIRTEYTCAVSPFETHMFITLEDLLLVYSSTGVEVINLRTGRSLQRLVGLPLKAIAFYCLHNTIFLSSYDGEEREDKLKLLSLHVKRKEKAPK
jgi:hypothetical protein